MAPKPIACTRQCTTEQREEHERAILPLLVAVILCMGGCSSNLLESVSDDSSREADIESARIAIDDGDYQRAADILEPGYDPLAPTTKSRGSLHLHIWEKPE